MRATGVRLACGTLLPQWSEESLVFHNCVSPKDAVLF
uniref:Glutamate rich 2 n=1 Tax=Homo sapiens TaxID=9606 RepID=A0A8V8TLB8_HUMAN